MMQQQCVSTSLVFLISLNFSLCFLRLFADILNDIAMFMEILAPYFPAFFTLIMCVSGIFKVRLNQKLMVMTQ